jgi:hypothetical protein
MQIYIKEGALYALPSVQGDGELQCVDKGKNAKNNSPSLHS